MSTTRGTAYKGKLITFEGGEGGGKSTQIKRLAKALEDKGHSVLVTREPGGTPAAEALRDVFITHKGYNWDVTAQAYWIFTARRLHLVEKILPALQAGQIVLCDRFTDSSRVYQGIAGGLGLDKLEQIKQNAIGAFEPDLTFILDIDPAVGLERAGKRQAGENSFEAKEKSFHDKIREGYRQICIENPQRCIMIEANRDKASIYKDIESACLKSLA